MYKLIFLLLFALNVIADGCWGSSNLGNTNANHLWTETNTFSGTGTFSSTVTFTTTSITDLEITGKFTFPVTTSSTVGVIYQGSDRFIHSAGSNNIFLGRNAPFFRTDVAQMLDSGRCAPFFGAEMAEKRYLAPQNRQTVGKGNLD